MMNSNVIIGNPFDHLDRNRNRKVVFYGRVSTEHEAQMSALENQLKWYDDQAKFHPNWNVVDKYIDEGITGTQAKKRPAFLKMIEDAKKEKFDLIVTREVCRFARNTVDTLVVTRQLKDIGIEVFFVSDNIWTMDNDGELRLTIMATLAQEESRKVSERVKAGQHISRENKTIYGCGNILGYDRVGDTYVINEEQAETVRMIYAMYLKGELGATKIGNELTRLGRLNASGNVKWNASSVTRILKNQTYMGYMAYGKSYSNNYLEQKRHNVHDESKYLLVKCDFEPIISEEDWYKAQDIRSSRVVDSLTKAIDTRKTNATHGVPYNKDLWCNKLRCACGARLRKNRWHKNKGKPWSYGYQCYNILNNGSAKKRIEQGADPTGYCDMSIIPDWKLDLMAKKIMEEIWTERSSTIAKACELIKDCYRPDSPRKFNITGIASQMERIKSKKNILLEMRTDGEIDKDEYLAQKAKLDKQLDDLQKEYEAIETAKEIAASPEICWDTIQETLEQIIDFDVPKLDDELLKRYISRVVPIDKTHFIWYLNIGEDNLTELDAVVEGRKNNAVVYFDGEGEHPPIHEGDKLPFSMLEKADKAKKSSLLPILHRPLLRKWTNFAFVDFGQSLI